MAEKGWANWTPEKNYNLPLESTIQEPEKVSNLFPESIKQGADDGLFVDWLSIWQVHEPHASLNSGAIITYDGAGQAVFERHRAARLRGSYSTSIAVKSDGRSVVVSGNVGRLGRPDNLFGYSPRDALAKANQALTYAGLPTFDEHCTVDVGASGAGVAGVGTGALSGAFAGRVNLSRVDITRNFSTGSPAAAAAVIRAISGKHIVRVKKGIAGEHSVWWSNTRYMLKVYIKHLEMEAKGCAEGEAYSFAKAHGVVRVELELKRREIADLGWADFAVFCEAWKMGTVHLLFDEYSKMLNVNAVSGNAEFIDALPQRLRVVASAFLAGEDVKRIMSRASFYRYRKALLDYGVDIADERPVRLNVQVRTVQLEPLQAPDWYWRVAA